MVRKKDTNKSLGNKKDNDDDATMNLLKGNYKENVVNKNVSNNNKSKQIKKKHDNNNVDKTKKNNKYVNDK